MNDDLTDRLSRELHEQVDDWQTAPMTLESVRGRAHGIRRRRRIAAAGVAAVAVAAIAVPAALLGDVTGRADRPPEIAETPSQAVEPTPRADGTFPLTLDVPEGEATDTGYLQGKRYVTADGTLELPAFFAQLLPFDGGWIGIRTPGREGGDIEVVTLDADLQETSAVPTPGGLVQSSDRSRVAWVEKTGNGSDWTIVNAPVDGGEPIRVATSENTTVLGFLADDTVATAYEILDTAEVFYGEAGPEGEFDSRVLSGTDELSEYQWVRGLSDAAGLVAGQTSYQGDSSCSEVRDTAAEEMVFETCDHQLGDLSPDGRWVIGYQSSYDLGSPSLAILDATSGLPIVEYTSSPRQQRAAIVLEATWEDDDTVVAVVEQAREQAVLRFESDGSVTRVSELRSPQGMTIEFSLPGKPFGQN